MADAITAEWEADPLWRTWIMLINGYGYNWYKAENLLRADDVLIRSRASEHLEAAAARLRQLENDYRRKFIPPPTRAQPDADPQRLAAVRRLRAVAERVLEIDTRLRGAEVPPDDKIWLRNHAEIDRLEALSQCDVVLVGATKEVENLVAALPPDEPLAGDAEALIDARLAALHTALAQRRDVLNQMARLPG